MKTTPIFVILYLVLMIPTYLLPYLGSNSSVVNLVTMGTNPLFWLHLMCLLILIIITWSRGKAIEKSSIVIFPILATAFDLLPGLSLVPLVPTVMHILAIVLGVSGQERERV